MMGSGGGGQQQAGGTTEVEPWEAQEPYLRQMFRQAQALYGRGGPEAYGGQMVAGMSPAEKKAQRVATRAATGEQTRLARRAAASGRFMLDPGILDPSSNRYLAASAEAATRPLYQHYAEQIAPNIRAEALQSGAYGSNRQAIAEGLAARETARQAGDITSQMYSGAYGQGLQAMEAAQRMVPQIQAMQLAPAQTLAGVGAQQRAYQQALIDAEIQRYNYQQAQPYANLAQYQNYLQGGYGGTTTGRPDQPGGGSPWMQAIGGGLMGAGTGAMLGAPFGPPGMAIGAGAMGTMGLLAPFMG
jgi:hypothetical protein